MKQIIVIATLSAGCISQLHGSQIQISRKNNNKIKQTETVHPNTPASPLAQKLQAEENQRNSDSYVNVNDDSASGFSSAFSSANLSPVHQGIMGSLENSGESSGRLTPIPSAPDMAQEDVPVKPHSASQVRFDTGESDDDILKSDEDDEDSHGQQSNPIAAQDIEQENKIKEEQAALEELKQKTKMFIDDFHKILRDANIAQNLSWNENNYDEPLLTFIKAISTEIEIRDRSYNKVGLWRYLPYKLQPDYVRRTLTDAERKYKLAVDGLFKDLLKQQNKNNSIPLWYAVDEIKNNQKGAEVLCYCLYNKRDGFVQTVQKSFNQRPYHYALGVLGITLTALTLVKTNKK